jgi:hypothetical protein
MQSVSTGLRTGGDGRNQHEAMLLAQHACRFSEERKRL